MTGAEALYTGEVSDTLDRTVAFRGTSHSVDDRASTSFPLITSEKPEKAATGYALVIYTALPLALRSYLPRAPKGGGKKPLLEKSHILKK